MEKMAQLVELGFVCVFKFKKKYSVCQIALHLLFTPELILIKMNFSLHNLKRTKKTFMKRSQSQLYYHHETWQSFAETREK